MSSSKSSGDRLIISAALTGSWPTKAQNPAVPVTEDKVPEWSPNT